MTGRGEWIRSVSATAMKSLTEFSVCAECRLCCSAPSMPVYITPDDRPHLPTIGALETSFDVCGDCRFLTSSGCSMGPADRPTECRAYPFFYLDGRIGLDKACPLTPLIKEALNQRDRRWLTFLHAIAREFERATDLDPGFGPRASWFWEDSDDALR